MVAQGVSIALSPLASRRRRRRQVASDDPRWPVGSRVLALGSRQDMEWVSPARNRLRLIPEDISSPDAIGLMGLNALTAYFGLVVEGEPKPGQTLVVSSAAGSVGSIAAQIGRIFGCRVVGLAVRKQNGGGSLTSVASMRRSTTPSRMSRADLTSSARLASTSSSTMSAANSSITRWRFCCAARSLDTMLQIPWRAGRSI